MWSAAMNIKNWNWFQGLDVQKKLTRAAELIELLLAVSRQHRQRAWYVRGPERREDRRLCHRRDGQRAGRRRTHRGRGLRLPPCSSVTTSSSLPTREPRPWMPPGTSALTLSAKWKRQWGWNNTTNGVSPSRCAYSICRSSSALSVHTVRPQFSLLFYADKMQVWFLISTLSPNTCECSFRFLAI